MSSGGLQQPGNHPGLQDPSGGGGVSKIIAGDGIAVDPASGVGNVTVSLAPSDRPKFQLAFGYGQGPAGNDDLAADSIWLQPQTIAGSYEPGQIHEWPTPRPLAFLGMTIFVDAAEIILAEGGEDPRFIITVDGVDTVFQVALTEGTHTEEILQASGAVAVLANSRIGVRLDAAGVDTGNTQRCEVILDGAETGSAVPPPPIPTSGLLADWASENYVLAIESGINYRGNWTDDSGNSNDLHTGLGSDITAFPFTEPGAFNDDAGVTFVRGVTTSVPTTLGNPFVFYAPNGPRTLAFVIRADNISPGNLFEARGSHVYALQGASLPQPVYIQPDGGGPIPINNTGTFRDINGQKVVIMFWTEGANGDQLHMAINGVEVEPLSSTMPTEAAFTDLGIGQGAFIAPLSFILDGSVARGLAWNRVLTVSERIGVLSNLTERYL